jgi:hypothetical protein
MGEIKTNIQRSEGDNVIDEETTKALRKTIQSINKRIFVPLQNQGADDFKSKRRNWEQALERGQSLVDMSEEEWFYKHIEKVPSFTETRLKKYLKEKETLDFYERKEWETWFKDQGINIFDKNNLGQLKNERHEALQQMKEGSKKS